MVTRKKLMQLALAGVLLLVGGTSSVNGGSLEQQFTYAIKNGNEEVMDELIPHFKLDINKNKGDALYLALCYGNQGIVRKLLSSGATVYKRHRMLAKIIQNGLHSGEDLEIDENEAASRKAACRLILHSCKIKIAPKKRYARRLFRKKISS